MGRSKGPELTDALKRRCLALSVKDRADLVTLLSRSMGEEMHETEWEMMERGVSLMRSLFGNDIRRKNRERDVVDLRTVFCYRMRQEGMYFRTIGEFLGQDHSTVLCSCRRMEDALRFPKIYAGMVEMYNRFNESFTA